MSDKVQFLEPKWISIDKLRALEGNSNQQSPDTFERLKENISNVKFDEVLTTVANEDGTYTIMSGNHRLQALKELGAEGVYCTVHEDWDEVTTQLQSIRRNYDRGDLNKLKFTAQVASLMDAHEGLSTEDVMEGAGFSSEDAFTQLYQDTLSEDRELVAQARAEIDASTPASVRIVDDLNLTLSHILSEHGDTLPQSFIIFPMGGKNHMMISTTPALKRTLESIAHACFSKKLDINIALGGLLAMGLKQSDFLDGDEQAAIEAGTEEGESDLDLVIE